jgi:hypothetical protein
VTSDAGSYPARRPKAKNLRFQHLRQFVMWSVLPSQNLFNISGLRDNNPIFPQKSPQN